MRFAALDDVYVWSISFRLAKRPSVSPVTKTHLLSRFPVLMTRTTVPTVHGARYVTKLARPLRGALTFHRCAAKMSSTVNTATTVVAGKIGEASVGFAYLGIFDHIYFITQLSFVPLMAHTIKDVIFNRAIAMDTTERLARRKGLVYCSSMSLGYPLQQWASKRGHRKSWGYQNTEEC